MTQTISALRSDTYYDHFINTWVKFIAKQFLNLIKTAVNNQKENSWWHNICASSFNSFQMCFITVKMTCFNENAVNSFMWSYDFKTIDFIVFLEKHLGFCETDLSVHLTSPLFNLLLALCVHPHSSLLLLLHSSLLLSFSSSDLFPLFHNSAIHTIINSHRLKELHSQW